MKRLGAAFAVAGGLALTHVGSLAAQGRYSYQTNRSDRLTGTYQLDRSRSDDPFQVADRALQQLPAADRDRVSRRLTNRLDPPDVLSVERSGARVRMASSRAPEMSFDANGQSRTEPGIGGRNMTTRASLSGDRLEVSTRGAAGNDFTVTFEPLNDNSGLRVTRRLFDDRLRQPVIVRSVYNRVSDVPDWDVYSSSSTSGDRQYGSGYGSGRSQYGYGSSGYRSSRGAVVPEGTTLVATLDQAINTRTVRDGDRVTLTVVNAPTSDLENAIIEGSVVTAPVNSRDGLTMEFDRLRLRDGRTADFAGTIESVRGPNGEAISYNGEQVEPDSNRTQQAIQRGAIGAAIGALIGAVAGGGKGAAVGAVLGGGGAAATVFVGQQNQSSLPRGTEFTIRTERR